MTEESGKNCSMAATSIISGSLKVTVRGPDGKIKGFNELEVKVKND
jgi:hypothetical protein